MDYEEEQEGAAGGGFDLGYWFAGALRHRWLIIITTACGVLFSAMQAARLPMEYQSEGSLYVRPGVGASLTPESAFADNSGSRLTSRDWVMNELQVLNSPLLYQKAVRIAGVETVLAPDTSDSDSGSIKDRLRALAAYVDEWLLPAGGEDKADLPEEIRALNASLVLATRSSIRATPRTTVISISSRADTAAKARAFTNALLDAAVELHSEVGETMGSLTQVEKELATTEKLAASAAKALDEFCAANDIYDFVSQKSSLVRALLEQEQALRSTASDLLRADSERDLLELSLIHI